MKTLFRILRSIVASLLFIVTTFVLCIQFIFIFANNEEKNIPNLIQREKLLYAIIDKEIEVDQIKELSLDYIDDQINYIFHKRSFPSTQNIDFDILEEEYRLEARRIIDELKEELDIEYATIIKMRELNGTLSNGAIFLLINISVLVVVLITAIIKKSFASSLKILGLASIFTGTITLFLGKMTYSNFGSMLEPKIYNIASSIINDEIIGNYADISLTYFFIGFLLLFLIYYFDKILKKDYRLF